MSKSNTRLKVGVLKEWIGSEKPKNKYKSIRIFIYELNKNKSIKYIIK